MVSCYFISCLYLSSYLSVIHHSYYYNIFLYLFIILVISIISYGQLVGFEHRWLVIAANTTVRLQGFLDAITYGLTEGIIRRWTNIIISPFLYCCSCSKDPNTSQENSSIPSKSYPSQDSSSILFYTEGYLWDRLVPSEHPQSSHESVSISDSGYYTPFTTSRDLYFLQGNNNNTYPNISNYPNPTTNPRERDYLNNKIIV